MHLQSAPLLAARHMSFVEVSKNVSSVTTNFIFLAWRPSLKNVTAGDDSQLAAAIAKLLEGIPAHGALSH